MIEKEYKFANSWYGFCYDEEKTQTLISKYGFAERDYGYDGAEILPQLVGRTIKEVTISKDEDELYFEFGDGLVVKFYHAQDCCEKVNINDVIGNLDDLVGSPLTMCEVSTSEERPFDSKLPEREDHSQTWTFYRFATIKGYVTVRWFGSSKGNYSERVDIDLGEVVDTSII